MPVRIPTFYNLSQSIGKGKPNNPLDVMLVQFFLNESTKSKKAVRADGVLDEGTLDIIKFYQERSRYLYADGIVDPVPQHNLSAPSPVHRRRYTISELNFHVELAQPKSFDRLWEHPRCPAPLASGLVGMYLSTYGLG